MYRNSPYYPSHFSVSLKFYQRKKLKGNAKGTLGPKGWRNTVVRSIPAKEILGSYSSRKCMVLISEAGVGRGSRGERKGQEDDFINKAREFDYDPFLNPNLCFVSPFIRTPLPARSTCTEKLLSKRQSRSDFLISLEMRKRRSRQERFS